MRQRHTLMCLLFIILLGNTANSQSEFHGQPRPERTDYDTVFAVRVDSISAPFQFHVRVTSVKADSLSESLGIRDRFYHITVGRGLHDTLQQIEGSSYEGLWLGPFNEFFQCEDINFDGYVDFRYEVSAGATGNATFEHWIFQPEIIVVACEISTYPHSSCRILSFS